jgi:hypothetical protein
LSCNPSFGNAASHPACAAAPRKRGDQHPDRFDVITFADSLEHRHEVPDGSDQVSLRKMLRRPALRRTRGKARTLVLNRETKADDLEADLHAAICTLGKHGISPREMLVRHLRPAKV